MFPIQGGGGGGFGPGGGPDLGSLAFKVGATSKRRELEDEMKRKRLMRQIDDMAQQMPGALESIVGGTNSGGGNPVLGGGGAPAFGGGPSPFGGGGGMRRGDGRPSVYPGSPAYYGADWGQSDPNTWGPPKEDGVALARVNNPLTDEQYQKQKQAEASKSSDELYAFQKALNAKHAGAPTAATTAPTVDTKAQIAAQKQIDALNVKIATAKGKGEDTSALEGVLAEIKGRTAAPAAASKPSAGEAFVDTDPVGVSLTGNTPDALKGILARKMAMGGGEPAPLPTALLPSHEGGVPIDVTAPEVVAPEVPVVESPEQRLARLKKEAAAKKKG